ncbi:hypothetical protein B0F90DRAFT_1236211 [Multifurca ochricompacta]|uniref:Uncharacterized protein n=1 Tax=Multifurca ochricompacta TaxID=376703 RepID=A0AAD4QMK4_9AGAM|nr:hypothetical protein B0F90DRAFT_1236211 [Multifurca ochricompacta]
MVWQGQEYKGVWLFYLHQASQPLVNTCTFYRGVDFTSCRRNLCVPLVHRITQVVGPRSDCQTSNFADNPSSSMVGMVFPCRVRHAKANISMLSRSYAANRTASTPEYRTVRRARLEKHASLTYNGYLFSSITSPVKSHPIICRCIEFPHQKPSRGSLG